MKNIDTSKPVLVTGGSGYIASWIIKQLLDEGKLVHTTVRDLNDQKKYQHLRDLATKASGKLEIFEADLLKKGSFEKAMRNCELVMHTASPFFIQGVKNPEKELIEPAKNGTRNVLESANKVASVKRVIVTSSVAAIYGDNIDCRKAPNGILTESNWNTSSDINNQPYSYSKTLAEKEAWDIQQKQERWDLITINPGFVLGPSLTKRTDSTSINSVIQLADGTFKSGAPDLWFGIVDVRDVAKAHIKAGYTPEAQGRYITYNESGTFLEMGNILKAKFGSKYPFPKRKAPKFLMWLLAPKLGVSRKFVSNNVGIPLRIDNSKSRVELQMNYLPLKQTLHDQFQQLLDDNIISPN